MPRQSPSVFISAESGVTSAVSRSELEQRAKNIDETASVLGTRQFEEEIRTSMTRQHATCVQIVSF